MNYRKCNHVHDVYWPDAMSPYSKCAPSHRMKQLWDADGCHPHWSPAQSLCVTSLVCCNCGSSHLGIPWYQQNCKQGPNGCPKRLKPGWRVPQALEKEKKFRVLGRVWELISKNNKNINFVLQKVSRFLNAAEKRLSSPTANQSNS